MLLIILIVGFLFLGVIFRLAEGLIRIILILAVLVILGIGSLFSTHSDTAPSAPVVTQNP